MKTIISKYKSICILILGMHRSGTSCLAGTLNRNGIYFGNVSKKNVYNLKGNYENKMITKLNNSLLNYNNGSWDKPPDNIKWSSHHSFSKNKLLNNYYRNKIFGIKDPRFLITFPFWEDCCLKTYYIGIFRHPYNVALSLYKRNRMPILKGLSLWYYYNIKLYNIAVRKKIPLLSFDVSKNEFFNKLFFIIKQFNLNIKMIEDISFYDENLIHNNISFPIIPGKVKTLYNKLLKIYLYY